MYCFETHAFETREDAGRRHQVAMYWSRNAGKKAAPKGQQHDGRVGSYGIWYRMPLLKQRPQIFWHKDLSNR